MKIRVRHTLRLKDKLTFGKHKGKTIKEVLDNDPQYLVWLHEKTKHKLQRVIYNEAELSYRDIDEAEYTVFGDEYWKED